jgi:hypothetical protein
MFHGNGSLRATIVWHHWFFVVVIHKAALFGRQVAMPQVCLGERSRVVFPSNWRQKTSLSGNVLVREISVLERTVRVGRQHQASTIAPDCEAIFASDGLVNVMRVPAKNASTPSIEKAGSHRFQSAATNALGESL